MARFADPVWDTRCANRAIISGEDTGPPTMWNTPPVRVRTPPLVCVMSDSGALSILERDLAQPERKVGCKM
jgi:hypothetical protein